jgi:hypothetical protein
MPYTYRSLTFAWLIILTLVALSASGAADGWWLILLLAAALALPALILRTQANAVAASPERPLIVADGRERSPIDLGGIDVLGWESEGGARPMPLRDGLRVPA